MPQFGGKEEGERGRLDLEGRRTTTRGGGPKGKGEARGKEVERGRKRGEREGRRREGGREGEREGGKEGRREVRKEGRGDIPHPSPPPPPSQVYDMLDELQAIHEDLVKGLKTSMQKCGELMREKVREGEWEGRRE